MSETMRCPDCDDIDLSESVFHAHPVGNHLCNICHGLGKLRTVIDDIAEGLGDRHDYEEGYDDCWNCHGSGQCQTCGGDGVIVRDDDADIENEEHVEVDRQRSGISIPSDGAQRTTKETDDSYGYYSSTVNLNKRLDPHIHGLQGKAFVIGLKLVVAVLLIVAGVLIWNRVSVLSFRTRSAATATTDWTSAKWGVLQSSDGGRSWKQTLSTPNQVGAVLMGTDGNIVIATEGYLTGGGERPQIYRSGDFGEHWNKTAIASYVNALIPLGNGSILSGGIFGLFSSSDNGFTWSKIGSGPSDGILSLVRDSKGALYAGSRMGIFKSMDQGKNWHAIGLARKIVRKLLVGTRNQLFAGTNKGLFQSRDEGKTWTLVAGGVPNKWVDALAGSMEGTLYAAFVGNGVYRSIDRGRTWTRVLSLGNKTITYEIMVPERGKLFVSAGACCPVNPASLFYSSDSGKNWSRLLNVYNEKAVGMIATNQSGEILVGLTWVGE